MDVVFHQAIRHQFKAQLQAVALHRTQEALVVLVVLKQDLPADAPQDDVVISAFALLACRPRHKWSHPSPGRIIPREGCGCQENRPHDTVPMTLLLVIANYQTVYHIPFAIILNIYPYSRYSPQSSFSTTLWLQAHHTFWFQTNNKADN